MGVKNNSLHDHALTYVLLWKKTDLLVFFQWQGSLCTAGILITPKSFSTSPSLESFPPFFLNHATSNVAPAPWFHEELGVEFLQVIIK